MPIHQENPYEAILTDAIARFKRLQGYDVFFLTGTDEHGQKIEELAKEAGIQPQTYVDKVAVKETDQGKIWGFHITFTYLNGVIVDMRLDESIYGTNEEC